LRSQPRWWSEKHCGRWVREQNWTAARVEVPRRE
jgi:hypothetical protein